MTLALLVAATSLSSAGELTIPHETYELDNGLEVILAPDMSTPVVHVELWYHVGSKDERAGLTGFAHLFEHLMFQGSQNTPGEYFTPLQEIGGRINGTTSSDRTNYYETVPAQYLPLALFMESDRLGWFLPTLDQAKLDNQREVVRNERRQSYENPPYGKVYLDLYAAVFPDGHPYHHQPIGSHEDLEAADLEAVKEFFSTWYVPNNASLVISGYFDSEQAKALVDQYFGDIPAGPEPQARTAAPPTMDEPIVIRQFQEVPEQKVWLAWVSPPLYAAGDAELDLLSSVLTGGKDSRLHKELVKRRKVAKDISAFQASDQLASVYVISGTAAPGHTTDEVVAAVDEVLAEVFDTAPPTDAEIEAARAAFETGFWGALTTVAGKAGYLSRYNHYAGDTDYLAKDLQRYTDATPADVREWGEKVLGQPRVELHVWPNDDREGE